MKNIRLLSLLTLSIMLFSCVKESGNYKLTQPTQETRNWEDSYSDYGVLPNESDNITNNYLVGVRLLLTEVVTGFASTSKNDTIEFIDNTHYRINSDTTKFEYRLYETMGNSTLDFYLFVPINGLYITANNFRSSVFVYLNKGGSVSLIFKDKLSPQTAYTTTFIKI